MTMLLSAAAEVLEMLDDSESVGVISTGISVEYQSFPVWMMCSVAAKTTWI